MSQMVFSIVMFIFGALTASGLIFMILYHNQFHFFKKGKAYEDGFKKREYYGDLFEDNENYYGLRIVFVVMYLVSSALQLCTMLTTVFTNL